MTRDTEPTKRRAALWPPDLVAHLHRLWVREHCTAALAAAELTRLSGRVVTRNAVIGKVRRLGLVGEGCPSRSLARRLGPTSAIPAPIHALGLWPISALRDGQCRYACTPDDASSHRFCGAATQVGPGNLHGSWCETHRAVVFGPGTISERNALRFDRRAA